MSTPPTQQGTINFSDNKAVYKAYCDGKKWQLFFAGLLLFFGLVIYLQVCAANCSGFDPSGLVGSSVNSSNGDEDSTTLNGTSTGCLISISVFFVLIGAGMFMYYQAVVNKSHKLIEANMPYAAATIDLEKGKTLDTNLLAYQTAIFEEQSIKAGIDPATLVDNPYAAKASDDAASDSGDQ